MPARRTAAIAAAIGLAASALLAAHARVLGGGTPLADLRAPRRYWEDVCVAVKEFVDGRYTPESAPPPAARSFEEGFALCQELVTGGAARQEIRPGQFWRTIHLRPFIWFREHLVGGRPFEDPGRAVVLAAGFRVLGGISPFLLIWLGVLAAVPVFFWIAWELARAGRSLAAGVFLLLLAGSPFFVDCLTLTHSGMGFYLVALLALAALASHAALSERVTASGLLVRALAAGVVFGVCVFCRSGTLALLPGFLAALAVAGGRLDVGRRRGLRWAVVATAFALLLAPGAAARRPQRHDVWIAVWEGLGDFDRTKGHYWADEDAQRVLAAAGFPPGRQRFDWVTHEAEAYLRGLVLDHVSSDPAWYGRILLRRVWATVTQAKVRAWSDQDWRAIWESVVPNEGSIAKYYSWATPVNRVGFGSARAAVPVLVLMAPTIGLLLLTVLAGRGPRAEVVRRPLVMSSVAVGCVALGAIALPVAITTASMPETEAFALAYLLGCAFFVQELVRWARPPRRAPSLDLGDGAAYGGPHSSQGGSSC